MERVHFNTGKHLSSFSLTSENQKTGSKDKSFEEMLKVHLSNVNNLQQAADTAIEKLVTGEEKDVHNTLIAMEKSGVAFQLTMQIRNKALEAYQEIMRMQV